MNLSFLLPNDYDFKNSETILHKIFRQYLFQLHLQHAPLLYHEIPRRDFNAVRRGRLPYSSSSPPVGEDMPPSVALAEEGCWCEE